jgi:hypothetical protein
MAVPRPWQRVTNEEKARAYFGAEALRRLAQLDPHARVPFVVRQEEYVRCGVVGR